MKHEFLLAEANHFALRTSQSVHLYTIMILIPDLLRSLLWSCQLFSPPRRPDRQTDICRLCMELLSCSCWRRALISSHPWPNLLLFPLLRIVYALHSHSHASFHLLIVYTHHDIWFPHWQQNYIYIQISNISILFMISVVSLFTLSSLCDAGKKSHYFLPRKFTSEADCADKYSKFISDVLRFSLS